MKCTAHEAAQELRKFADALDTQPDLQIVRPSVYMFHFAEKGTFLVLAKFLPLFLKKTVDPDGEPYGEFRLRYESKGMDLLSCIYRSALCKIVEPAKPAVYDCPSIFTEAEEAAAEQERQA